MNRLTIFRIDNTSWTQSFLNFSQLKCHPGTNFLQFNSTFVGSTVNSVEIACQIHHWCFFVCFTLRSITSPGKDFFKTKQFNSKKYLNYEFQFHFIDKIVYLCTLHVCFSKCFIDYNYNDWTTYNEIMKSLKSNLVMKSLTSWRLLKSGTWWFCTNFLTLRLTPTGCNLME